MPTTYITSDNRPSDYDYALLSQHVYEKPKQGTLLPNYADWKVHKVIEGGYWKSLGFYGVLYKNTKTRQAVVAFRGTSETITWLENLFSVFMNNKTSVQRLEAFKLVVESIDYANEENYQLSFTGHSLGGFLAELAVFYCHSSFDYPMVNAVTFESPGIREALANKLDSEHEPLSVDALDIVGYVSYPNIVNTCNHHIGTVYGLYPMLDRSQFGLLSKDVSEVHSMANIVKLFKEGQLQARHYMAKWPCGNQRHLFQKHCQRIEENTNEGDYIHYTLSLASDELKKHYAVEFQGQYKADEKLSDFTAIPLSQFQPALRTYLKAFYKQNLYLLDKDEVVKNQQVEMLKNLEVPPKIIECLLGYTVEKNNRGISYIQLRLKELTLPTFRGLLSEWLADNPSLAAKVLKSQGILDVGIAVYVAGLEDGANLMANTPLTVDNRGIDVDIPNNNQGAEYVARIAQPTLARVREVKVVGLPKGTFTISGTAPVTIKSTGIRFGMNLAEQAEQEKETHLRFSLTKEKQEGKEKAGDEKRSSGYSKAELIHQHRQQAGLAQSLSQVHQEEINPIPQL